MVIIRNMLCYSASRVQRLVCVTPLLCTVATLQPYLLNNPEQPIHLSTRTAPSLCSNLKQAVIRLSAVECNEGMVLESTVALNCILLYRV